MDSQHVQDDEDVCGWGQRIEQRRQPSGLLQEVHGALQDRSTWTTGPDRLVPDTAGKELRQRPLAKQADPARKSLKKKSDRWRDADLAVFSVGQQYNNGASREHMGGHDAHQFQRHGAVARILQFQSLDFGTERVAANRVLLGKLVCDSTTFCNYKDSQRHPN